MTIIDVPGTGGVQGDDLKVEFIGGGKQRVEHALLGGCLHLLQIIVEVRGCNDGEITVVALRHRHGHNSQLQSTGADHLRHGVLIAQNRVGVNFHLIASIGGGGELFAEIGQCNVLSVCLRLVECHPDDGAFLAVFASAAAAGQASGRGCKSCCTHHLEKGAAVDLLFHG